MKRMPCALTSVAALAALLVAPSPLAAQGDGDPGIRQHRGGFWLSGGLGVGADEEGDVGGAGYLRLGGTLGEHWALGADAVTVTHETELGPDLRDETVSHSNSTAALYFFPSLRSGLFLKLGMGIAIMEVSGEAGDATITVTDEAFGATLGAGWDLQLGDGNLYLTPNVDILAQDMELFFTTATVGIGFR